MNHGKGFLKISRSAWLEVSWIRVELTMGRLRQEGRGCLATFHLFITIRFVRRIRGFMGAAEGCPSLEGCPLHTPSPGLIGGPVEQHKGESEWGWERGGWELLLPSATPAKRR